MGSGKSTIGKLLAAKTAKKFIDLDNHIEKSEGKSIPQIFEQKGEVFFRSLEHRELKNTFIQNNLIVATGGGIPCFYNNMELINNTGLSIFIDVAPEVLLKRLVNAKEKRPVIKNKSEGDIIELINNRKKYYSKANLIIKAQGLSANEIVDKIIMQLK